MWLSRDVRRNIRRRTSAARLSIDPFKARYSGPPCGRSRAVGPRTDPGVTSNAPGRPAGRIGDVRGRTAHRPRTDRVEHADRRAGARIPALGSSPAIRSLSSEWTRRAVIPAGPGRESIALARARGEAYDWQESGESGVPGDSRRGLLRDPQELVKPVDTQKERSDAAAAGPRSGRVGRAGA